MRLEMWEMRLGCGVPTSQKLLSKRNNFGNIKLKKKKRNSGVA